MQLISQKNYRITIDWLLLKGNCNIWRLTAVQGYLINNLFVHVVKSVASPFCWPLLSIVEIRSAFPIAITYKYRKTDREKRKEKQKHILNILRHFVLYATRSRMDRRGERRRWKSWADTDKSCEAHLQESSTLAASGSRTELELERGFKGGRLKGKQCGLGLAILKHVAKCSRRGPRGRLAWP